MFIKEFSLFQIRSWVKWPIVSARRLKVVLAIVLLISVLTTTIAYADIPPRPGVKWPKGIRERLLNFNYKRSYIQMMQRIQRNRATLQRGEITMAAAQAAGGILVSGTKSIPILPVKFHNTGADPYPAANLQRELFDGPWPTGTMTEYYLQVSYGQFTVAGTVFPWRTVSKDDTYYEGGSGCNGVCGSSKVGELLQESMNLHDATVDFSQYDNDGPDGIPNSGDDDGYVDFVAFVHAEAGGECGNDNIWSHRWFYSGWTGSEYTTNDSRAGGGFIKIDDYVIMPAFGCYGSTMIQIGVFAHEFGHAFGLPDLYDTDPSNGDSEGVGIWCLMAAGSWGGDSSSPETPTHLCAWAKAYLGWVTPTDVTMDLSAATIPNIEDNSIVYKLPISSTQYYLVENRQEKGFDAKLPESGILIWHINETVINSGLSNNRVNADENNKGVDLEEADCKNDLDNCLNRGDGGDPFHGTTNNRYFNNLTCPSSSGSTAVCKISDSANSMTADLIISTGKCPSQTEIALRLSPDEPLKYRETAVLIAEVTLNGVPQAGKTVTFSSSNSGLASIIPPASVNTDSDGVAEAQVRGKSKSRRTVAVNAEVDGETKEIIVKVPDISILGLVFLMLCVIYVELIQKRVASMKK